MTLPPELGADADSGFVSIRDANGRPNAWLLRAEDHQQAGVISRLQFNLLAAAVQAVLTGNPADGVRSVSILHVANLQLFGPNSAASVRSGIMLAQAKARAGRTPDAIDLAERWSAKGGELFGPDGKSMHTAHLLRTGIEAAAGDLPLAGAETRKSIIATAMLAEEFDRARTLRKRMGVSLSRPGRNVDARYVNALTILPDLYAAAGEPLRERAALRRILVLGMIDDPEDRENGNIDLLLRLASLTSTQDHAVSQSFMEVSLAS